MAKAGVLILGTGVNAAAISDLLSNGHRPRYHLIGYAGSPERGARQVPETQVLGRAEDLYKIASQAHAKTVVVTMDERRGTFPVEAALQCRMEGIEVLEMATFCERLTGKIWVKELKPSALIFGGGFRRSAAYQAIKRASDLLLSLAGLVLLSPLLALIALLIKLDSPGPVFFIQERIGERGKRFRMVKFRSMHVGAEEETGPVWASERDDRITRVGRWLRQSRLDELPQLFNVLKGEMSLVGPRPERPFFVSQLEREIPYYAYRHAVKPGITGWAQIKYQYSSSVEQAMEKLQYDLFYAKHMSLWLDLRILLETIPVVLSGKGAV